MEEKLEELDELLEKKNSIIDGLENQVNQEREKAQAAKRPLATEGRVLGPPAREAPPPRAAPPLATSPRQRQL